MLMMGGGGSDIDIDIIPFYSEEGEGLMDRNER